MSNRIVTATTAVPIRDLDRLRDTLRTTDFLAVEAGPAFATAYDASPARAVALARGFAATLETNEDHRQLFQAVAGMDETHRRALVKGYRQEGQSRGVVQAISQLPRTQSRALMEVLVTREDGKVDKAAAKDVGAWLRDAGAVMRAHAMGLPSPDFDDAVADFFEDVGDAISDAVNSVVDALDAIGDAFAAAIADVVNWTLDAVKDLAHALYAAAATLAELVGKLATAGYEVLRTMLNGLEQIGIAMRNIVLAALELAQDVVVQVFRAIDQLGRTLAQLLQTIASAAAGLVRKAVEALIAIGKEVGNILNQALQFGLTLVRNVVSALLALGRTVTDILVTLVTRPQDLLDTVVRSFRDLGHTLGDLIDQTVAAGADLVRRVARSLVAIGEAVVDLVHEAVSAAIDVGRAIVRGVLEAGKAIVDLFTGLAGAAFAAVKRVTQILFDLGHSLLTVLRQLTRIAFGVLRDVIAAAFELGKTVAELTRSMVAFTYRVAARFIDAALEAGAAVADMLEAVVASGYFVLRKIVTGVLQALGPVGDVFEWLIQRGEALGSELWRQAVLAIRYVKHSVTEILDWARVQTAAVFDAMLLTIEAAGEALRTVIHWAEAAGDAAIELLAEATNRVGNSVEYLLSTIAMDVLPALGAALKGVLDAGMELVDVMAWALDQSLAVLQRAVAELLALGRTIADLVAATLANPGDALPNLLRALDAIGSTLRDVAAEVWTLGEVAAQAFARSALAVGHAVVDICKAALEAAGGAFGAVVSALLALLGGYRPMTAQEIAEARLVFGDGLDYDHIFFATDDLTNGIVFGIQDAISGDPDSRAFVTDSLVNFDPDDGPLGRRTMIHELTHVWQYQHTGSAYLSDAIAAHIEAAADGGSAYNYGYSTASTPEVTIPLDWSGTTESGPEGVFAGEGGADDLEPDASDWDDFNPEQQGQIIMHWYVRAHLLTPPRDTTAWDPYVELVRVPV